MRLLLFLAVIPATVVSLKCTVCEFALLPPHSQNCNETCDGDICFIVVNKFFNGTINAGCMHMHEGDSFDNEAICQRGAYDNRCACTTSDFCNDPKVKINSFRFTESPILENYQWLPQIQPPMPSLQPILSPEEIPSNSQETNETMTEELENGVESDLAHVLDSANATSILRNEENDQDQELTVKTTVGLNVREQTKQQTHLNLETSTPSKSFTPGQGSVEVTKVSQEPSAPKLDATRSRNVTSDGLPGPNSSGALRALQALLLTLLPLLALF